MRNCEVTGNTRLSCRLLKGIVDRSLDSRPPMAIPEAAFASDYHSTSPDPFSHNWVFRWKSALLLFVLSLVCYSNTGDCELVFDDISAVKDNKDLRPTQPILNLLWNDFWGTPMSKENSHKSYRPFTVLTFRWNYAWHGIEPFGYHVVNALLHACNSVLAYKTYTLFASGSCTVVSSLLFAVHPIHTEAVTGVVGRAELLSTLFGLLLFIFIATYRGRNWMWNTVIPGCLLLALFSKEQGITVVAICATYQIFCREGLTLKDLLRIARDFLCEKPKIHPAVRKVARNLWTLLLSSLALMFWRMRIMKGQLPIFTPFDNPASVAPFPTRQLTLTYLLPFNVWLLIFPWYLLCDYTMGTLPLLRSLTDPRNLANVFFLVFLLKIVHRSLTSKNVYERSVLVMVLAWMVFPFLPASNIFFPVGFVVAERILYMPSIGFCLLVGHGYDMLNRCRHTQKQLQKGLAVSLGVVIIIFLIRSLMRNLEWKSEDTVFRSGLRITQSNAKIFNNVGHVLEKTKRFDEALLFFQSATKAQPDDIGAWNNVGRTLNTLNRTSEAELAWRHAKDLLPQPKPGQLYQARIAPQHLNVFLNLGSIMAKNPARLEEADQIYRQAISMRSDYIEAYINRGDVLLKMNRTEEAVRIYQQALGIDSSNADIYYNLAVVHTELLQPEKALEYFNQALFINPDHQLALLNSAILMGDLKNNKFYGVIEERLLRVLRKEDNPNALFQLGLLMMDKNDSIEAERYFFKTVEVREDHKSALFNLALLMNNRKLHTESLKHLYRLVKFYPDHTKGWILIGDICINNLKNYADAEQSYRRVLSFEPSNFQAHHNLCVTLIEQRHLGEADECMSALAVLMQHDGQYLATHFRTIHERLQRRKWGGDPDSAPVFK